MMFALDKDSGELLVLSSPLDAPRHCKPIDVKDGYWLCFASPRAGSSLPSPEGGS